MVIDKITIDLETGLIVGIVTSTEETITVMETTETIGPIIGTIAGPEIEIIIGMEVDILIDQIMDGTVVVKGIGIETLVKTTVGLEKEKGTETEAAQERAPPLEVETKAVEIRIEMEIEDKIERAQEIDLSQGQDQVPM